MSQDKPVNRRSFFRLGLRELLKPLVESVEPVEQVAEQLAAMEKIKPSPRPENAHPVPYQKTPEPKCED